METILLAFHVLISLGLVGLVLIQHGKGADAGAAFGSGASCTVFGARGAASFMTRLTAGLATLFFINSLVLAYLAGQATPDNSLMDRATPAVEESAPANDLPADVPRVESDVPVVPNDVPSPQ